MAEIDITDFVRGDADPSDYSASIAETGYQDIGKRTWHAALGAETLLTTPEHIADWREYVKGFGAWEDEEIDGWSEQECNALFVQYISGDIREARELAPSDNDEGIDWPEYEKLCEVDQCNGNLFLGSDDCIYYYVGS